jgi:hypothetical protein
MKSLTDKWIYHEEYDNGEAEGELFLSQEGEQLSGKIIFTDHPDDGEASMIQEIVAGTLDQRKVRIDALEFDVIHSEHALNYELDRWFGVWVDEDTIIGMSVDEQGVEGHFVLKRE